MRGIAAIQISTPGPRLQVGQMVRAVLAASVALAITALHAQVSPGPETDLRTPPAQFDPAPDSPLPPTEPETPEIPTDGGDTSRPEPTADGGLEGLSLQLDYPQLEIAEDRAYIPLFFTILGAYTGTNDVTVRARFVGGSATPGEDFDLSTPVQAVPAQGGLGSLGWLPVPTLLDEVNEGTETALFELSIDGSTNPPVRMEVTLLDNLNPGEVGFVSTRFQINEGSTNGYAQIRLWRTLNTRQAATVTYRLEGSPSALAVLGGQTRRTATFAPGESQVFVRIPLVNNTEAEGTQTVTLTLEPAGDGLKLMKGFESTILTLADDETPAEAAPLSIREFESEDGRRGVMVSTTVSRGYQVRLEYSENGVDGPWKLAGVLEGADTERTAFDSFDALVMRMYRILTPEPLDQTFPW